ncbi:MAG TPA: efflux RND transporter periplasmic adaptor subunit [Verrucomicrobiae bacterium]|jgi:Cu(I)/Ag(I) efflux system membrane fusion protein|nr:efflux RND transporter periplasmic adaptor subunit [Verrucomicrobiae bacterium]
MSTKLICLLALIASAVWLTSGTQAMAATTSAASDIDYYTCTMHPSVHSKEPGKCPICGMDLVPVYKHPAETNTLLIQSGETNPTSEDEAPGEFTVPIERQQQIGVTYATVEEMPLQKTLRASGTVAAQISNRRDFVAPAAGSVISLGVGSAGETVEKGQTLLTIYSPDLLAEEQKFADAAKDYLATPNFGSRRTVENIRAQFEAAKNRLLLWNLTTNQIADLQKWETRVPHDTVEIQAPFSGIVQRLGTEPGKNFGMGDELLELTALRTVYVWATFYQDDLPLLKEGRPVDITSSAWPGEIFHGQIALVDPFLDADTRTVRVRIDVENTDLKLRPEMFVDVGLKIDTGKQLAVPVNAVMPTGEHNIVFVDKGRGELQPRFIELGAQYGDYYQVKSGLNEGERVIASGNFLIDAESQIQGALKSW